jgi:cytochrome P450
MNSSEEQDYFSDLSVLRDPYAFFEKIRAAGPVYQSQVHDILFVTGFEEALQVLNNTADFSSANSVQGAAVPLPFEPEGDDISAQLEKHRTEMYASDLVVTYDGTKHSASRSLLARLFVPSRLKANEAFMLEFANQLAAEVVAKGKCELVTEVATPFVTLVIADLLGVPAEDREEFRKILDAGRPAGDMEAKEAPNSTPALDQMQGYFVRYIGDRRANPRADVLTELATAKFPDGSTPDVMEVVKLAMFLFAAGQDTSAKLLANSMRFIVESPELQQRLRNDRNLIPGFLEEVLRLEGSTKMTSRVAVKKTRIGGHEIPAGKRIMIALAAANRDPRRWENPNAFKWDRPRVKEHLAFGRGAHTCIGNPLARAEVRVILDRLLEHTSEIRLSEEHHGPVGNRRLDYEPSFIIRGLERLFLEVEPRK